MGLVYADITLINGGDLEMVKRHIIGEKEVKQMSVRMIVDPSLSKIIVKRSNVL